MTRPVKPEDGMVITRDTVFAPGVYWLPNGISIAGDNVTLDGNGALLIGGGKGVGVTLKRLSSVTIRRLHIERYYHGVAAQACANLVIEQCAITRTHEIPGPDVFLDVWLDRSQAYGGAIFLNGVKDGRVTGNDLQHQQNGLLMYGCDNIEVSANNASYNSGFGIMLYESSNNRVLDNVADYCCRIYRAPRSANGYHNGADAAALVLMCNASRNVVRGNLLRSSGDGVFLGGFHKDQIPTPCNDNVFEKNDGSDSPNIAFEATFSERNVFRDNKADNCNYGFWLGWSSENTVASNQIRNNRVAGVAIEHGRGNRIENNLFERNRTGVQLWVNSDDARGAGTFRAYFPKNSESHATMLTGNTIQRSDTGVHCWTQREENLPLRCHDIVLENNIIDDNRIAVQFERVRDSRIVQNRITGNVEAGIKLIGCANVFAERNVME